jgi:A/G-specific adenine glycosylase
MSDFSLRLIAWQKIHGRHDLPWQQTRDPYRVWLSEIMLQQTQVAAVMPYYARFLERFPTLAALAAATVDDVMAQWSGLGYYARARNLHRCAQVISVEFAGRFPEDPDVIATLPGIGRSTANAIAVFCFGARVAILDGNVKRVLCRCFGIAGFPGATAVEKVLWQLAAAQLPTQDIDIYIQAQMDLGATVCHRGKPHCEQCPLAEICIARRDKRIAELPEARPRKAVPERSVTMLLLLEDDGDCVLLERRPPSGIWGGLLSLPELPDGISATEFAARLGYLAEHFVSLPMAAHGFTHFRLLMQPRLAQVVALPQVRESTLVRLQRSAIEEAALPAPIRLLLEQYLSGDE